MLVCMTAPLLVWQLDFAAVIFMCRTLDAALPYRDKTVSVHEAIQLVTSPRLDLKHLPEHACMHPADMTFYLY